MRQREREKEREESEEEHGGESPLQMSFEVKLLFLQCLTKLDMKSFCWDHNFNGYVFIKKESQLLMTPKAYLMRSESFLIV